MLRFFLLTAALILYGSLFPWEFHRLDPNFDIWRQLRSSWPDELNRWLFKDVLLNVAIYVPLGFLGVPAFPRPRWRSWVVPILCGIALSAVVEFAQLYTYTRVTSACDFLANATGTVLGTAIGHRVRLEWRHRTHLRSRPDELLILALFGAWQLFPFFPVHGRTALLGNLSELPHLDWLAFVTAFIGWLCAGLAARTLLPGRRVFWLGVLLPIKPLIVDRGLTGAEVVAAVLALVLLTQTVLPVRLVTVLAVALVALRELMPLTFSAAAIPFNWIPFRAALGADDWLRTSGILIDKLFLITAAIWLLWRSGVRLWLATAAMAAALIALELVQTHLPGRTPESTDAVLAIAAGLLLNLVHSRRARGT